MEVAEEFRAAVAPRGERRNSLMLCRHEQRPGLPVTKADILPRSSKSRRPAPNGK